MNQDYNIVNVITNSLMDKQSVNRNQGKFIYTSGEAKGFEKPKMNVQYVQGNSRTTHNSMP